jgi:superfamily II DNA/RNA helicase
MLDMGFQPQVDRIVRRLPRNRQTMFFSATLDGPVGELARAYTNSPARFEAEHANQQPSEIEHAFVSVTQDSKVETLVEHIRSTNGLTLVFVRTKRGADKLVQKLGRQNVRAVAMHGDMSQNARERALSQFESGKVTTLVATDVAARGLDLDDITHVINFDPPGEDKDYVHRTGRTGRAGRSGKAITFVLPEQQAETSHVARRLGYTEEFEDAGLRSARPKLMYTSRRGRRSKWYALTRPSRARAPCGRWRWPVSGPTTPPSAGARYRGSPRRIRRRRGIPATAPTRAGAAESA